MYTLYNYEFAECPLFISMQSKTLFGINFQILYHECNGKLCPECSYKLDGDCPGIYTLLGRTQTTKIPVRKTNAEIAELLHMSKRGVAKARRDGTLPEEYI